MSHLRPRCSTQPAVPPDVRPIIFHFVARWSSSSCPAEHTQACFYPLVSIRQEFNKSFSTLYGASLLFRKCRHHAFCPHLLHAVTFGYMCGILSAPTSKIMPRCCKGTAHGGVSVRSSTLLLRPFFQSHQATCQAQITSLEVFAESHIVTRRHSHPSRQVEEPS